MAAFRAVLADEQVLFTEGMRYILKSLDKPKVEVIAAAKTGKDLLEIIEKTEADLILSELNFSDMEYDQLIQAIKSIRPKVKLIIVSAYGEMKLVRSCFNLGVDGYILKSNAIETVQRGLLDVMQGKVFMGEGLHVAPTQDSANKMEGLGKKAAINDRFKIRQKLTRREEEILKLIIRGMNNRQIAKDLFISDQTVGVHKKNIMKKFDVNSTAALIQFAKVNRIV